MTTRKCNCGVEWEDVYTLTSIESSSFDVQKLVEVEVPDGGGDASKSPLAVEPSDFALLQSLLVRALSDAEYDNATEEVALCRRLLADMGDVA